MAQAPPKEHRTPHTIESGLSDFACTTTRGLIVTFTSHFTCLIWTAWLYYKSYAYKFVDQTNSHLFEL